VRTCFSGPYHTARNAFTDMENGNVTVHVEVDDASVPAKAAHVIDWSVPVSDVTRKIGCVPSGIFVAATFTVTGLVVLICTSGLRYVPEGGFGTLTPLICVMVSDDCEMVELLGTL
jgi:hypothetical protein